MGKQALRIEPVEKEIDETRNVITITTLKTRGSLVQSWTTNTYQQVIHVFLRGKYNAFSL